jgi:hypothetical protein
MALRILDWDICMMTVLDLLAQPLSRITLLVETCAGVLNTQILTLNNLSVLMVFENVELLECELITHHNINTHGQIELYLHIFLAPLDGYELHATFDLLWEKTFGMLRIRSIVGLRGVGCCGVQNIWRESKHDSLVL